MKVFILLFISVLYFGCTFQKPKCITCTRQAWWSIKTSNSNGTVYHIVIKASADTEKLRIDSVRIASCIIKDYHLSVLGKSNTSTYYKPGDSILISFNHLGFIDTIENNRKNENIIYYTLNNKNRRCKIDSIKTIKSLICP